MAQRPFTTFSAGPTPGDAFAAAQVPDSATHVEEVVVPDGADQSKLATFVQRAVVDATSLGAVPVEVRALVESTAGRLTDDPTLCLAVDMKAHPVGQKMLARIAPDDPDATPWLLFGLHDA